MNEPQKPKDEDESRPNPGWSPEILNWNPCPEGEELPDLYSIIREDSPLDRIQFLAQSYCPQEMFAALVWQRRFNEFNGKQVITDLYNNRDLWHSFLFGKGIYPKDSESLSFTLMLDILLAMANWSSMPEKSFTRFSRYPGDNLYVLAKNESSLVSKLIDLGKKWNADSVDIADHNNEEYGKYIELKLRKCLIEPDKTQLNPPSYDCKDGVVVIYWWD